MDKTFLSTIAGGLISLLGVLFALRQNQATFERNLKEERDKITQEREFSAKHKAFLAASEAVTHFIMYYVTLPDRELPKDGSIAQEVSAMSVTLSALHFFCGVETIRQTTALSQAMSVAFSEAMKSKLPVSVLGEDIKGVDIRIAGLEKLNEQLREEVIAILASDPSSPLLITNRQLIAENSEAISRLCSAKCDLMKRKYEETEKCRNVVMSSLPAVHEGLREVLLMARNELGFPIAADEYRSLISEATAKAQTSINDLLQKVRDEVVEKIG